jgi:hypothetical protein
VGRAFNARVPRRPTPVVQRLRRPRGVPLRAVARRKAMTYGDYVRAKADFDKASVPLVSTNKYW